MLDRRKNPREFFIAGWDPYILALVAQHPRRGRRVEDTARTSRLGPTRWRTMLLRKPPPRDR